MGQVARLATMDKEYIARAKEQQLSKANQPGPHHKCTRSSQRLRRDPGRTHSLVCMLSRSLEAVAVFDLDMVQALQAAGYSTMP